MTSPDRHLDGDAAIRVTWHGHATLLIEDRARVLTDPVLAGRCRVLREIAGPVPRADGGDPEYFSGYLGGG